MPYRQEAEAVLSRWREVERALTAAAPGSPEFERLTAEATRLRDEYQQLVRDALANDRPAPAAWPETSEPDA
jgi:hypothetical protein